MKVTYIEEITCRTAWFPSMCCPYCTHYKYFLHHQTQPETAAAWWVECVKCGHTGEAMSTKELALASWKHELT